MTITKTRKYIKARKICNTFKHQSNFQLYAYLESQGYYWDNVTKEWRHIGKSQTKMRISFYIDSCLYNELEKPATIQRRTMTDLMIECIEERLTKLILGLTNTAKR